MSLLKRAAEGIDMKAMNLPILQRSQLIGLNQGVTIYPTGNDDTFINKGYNMNPWVYAIVSKCAKKFGQIPFLHYKIKTSERKTYFNEYLTLTKSGQLADIRVRIEMRKMLKKSVDQVAVDSPLSKMLQKPNRNQSGAAYREQLYGYKLLSGEGNTYFSRNEPGEVPVEWFIIPKQFLAMIKGADALADISGYQLILGGNIKDLPKDDILMWKFPNYNFDPIMLGHLRGLSPLNAGALLLQSSNEAAERMIAMNKNQGVAGLAFEKSRTERPTPEQAMFQRKQFNAIVNNNDLAGSIAVMNGEWGYIQFGLDAGQLKLLEQSDVQFKALCNIFDVPWQLFGNADSYENRKQYKRDLIYDNIAVAAYSYRDELNAKLIREYNLDRERDVIDCDIMSLPELAEDQDKQAAFIEKMAHRITPNEGRELVGYDRSPDPNMDKHYVQGTLQSLDQLNEPTGGNLDNELNLLNQ